MNTDIGRIIDKTLKKEGYYSNDSADPGGETKFGISHKAYPDLDIASLTLDDAKIIYERDYYTPLGFHGERIDYRWKLFDIAVNMGISVALKFKQLVTPLVPDYDTALQQLQRLQAERYIDLTKRNPGLKKFLRGWILRAGDLGTDLLA
jgi:lysozyme family protein